MSFIAKLDDAWFIFAQSGRLQGLVKSALQEASMILGSSSGSVVNCDHRQDIFWCKPLFSNLYNEDAY